MRSVLRRYRELAIVATLLALPLLLFLSNVRDPGSRTVLDRAVLTAFAPVQAGVVAAVEWGQDLWFGYVALRGVRDENRALRVENLQLRGETAAAEELRRENARLRDLLGFLEEADREAVAAPVVAIGARPSLARTVRLGRGRRHGVRAGLPVVTPEGIVGRVVASGPTWADVLLIADPNSAVPVLAGRSRARATVRGTGSLSRADLDHATRTDDFEADDLLVTSGTDGVFPKGLPVGRVEQVERRPHGMFLEATVVFAADLARLEEVLVLAEPQPVESLAPQPSGARDGW